MAKVLTMDNGYKDAIRGIHVLPDIELEFENDKNNKVKTPVYVLPLFFIEHWGEAILNVDGRVCQSQNLYFTECSLDDLEERCAGRTAVYRFYADEKGISFRYRGCGLNKGKERDESLILTLNHGDFYDYIGNMEGKKFIGKRYSVCGLREKNIEYPLLCAFEDSEKIIVSGFYHTGGGSIGISPRTYSQQNMIDELQKQLKDFFKWVCTETWKPFTPKPFTIIQSKEEQKKQEEQPKAKTLESAVNDEHENVSSSSSIITTDSEINWEEPKTIVKYLDQYVIGQQEAKRKVAVAFSNYMTRLRTKNEKITKDNMILIGPSGVGKTYMISLLAKKASLPFIQSKLTSKSSEGYVGENISRIYDDLKTQTNDEAPYAVIFLDEIDKLARDEWGSGSGFGTRIQDELIGWLEEAVILGSGRSDNKDIKKLNTKNILYVTAGAFQGVGSYRGLADIIQTRLSNGQKAIGFNVDIKEKQDKRLEQKDILHKVQPEDIILYGLKTELVGRIPTVAVLDQLTTEDKVRILNEAKRSVLTKYFELLSSKDYTLNIDDETKVYIAECCPPETGARALESICANLFTDILFEPENFADSSKTIRVTPDLAKKLINLNA